MQKIEDTIFHKIIEDSRTLSLDELRDLVGRLEQEVRNRVEALTPIDEMAKEKSAGSLCYQLVKTRCGKKGCKCAKGELHGPYWYACFRENGVNKRKYVGKTLPDGEALLKFSARLRKRAAIVRAKNDQKWAK